MTNNVVSLARYRQALASRELYHVLRVADVLDEVWRKAERERVVYDMPDLTDIFTKQAQP